MSPFGPGLILGAKMLVSGRVLLQVLLLLLRTTTTAIATATSTAITTGRICSPPGAADCSYDCLLFQTYLQTSSYLL